MKLKLALFQYSILLIVIGKDRGLLLPPTQTAITSFDKSDLTGAPKDRPIGVERCAVGVNFPSPYHLEWDRVKTYNSSTIAFTINASYSFDVANESLLI